MMLVVGGTQLQYKFNRNTIQIQQKYNANTVYVQYKYNTKDEEEGPHDAGGWW